MELDQTATAQPMKLRQALLIYAVLVVATYIVAHLALTATWFHGSLYFVWYFAAGLYLNRAVLRRIIVWHPVYNTVDNVANGKLSMFLFWPIAYAVLFLKLGVGRVL